MKTITAAVFPQSVFLQIQKNALFCRSSDLHLKRFPLLPSQVSPMTDSRQRSGNLGAYSAGKRGDSHPIPLLISSGYMTPKEPQNNIQFYGFIIADILYYATGIFPALHDFLVGRGKHQTGKEHAGRRGKLQMVGKQRLHNTIYQKTQNKNCHEFFRQLRIAEIEAD